VLRTTPPRELDVVVGLSLFTRHCGLFIIVACAATLYVHGMGPIQVASDAAESHAPTGRRTTHSSSSPSGVQRLGLRGLYSADSTALHGMRGAWVSSQASIRTSGRRRSFTGSITLLIAGGAANRAASAATRN